MGTPQNELLTALLRDVSRSFYLTIAVLPSSIRSQISLAYLLARATDTIADTKAVSSEERLQTLQKLRQRILGQQSELLSFANIAREQASPGERLLLERIEDALSLLNSFSEEDQERIRAVLDTITSGQELDLRRFAGASTDQINALHTDAELDDYTYRVAGCVGEFWTRMCRAHVFPRHPTDDALLLNNGIRFGKGLQLVNILRDLPIDLRNGRCYLPSERLAEHSLSPADLLISSNEPRMRPAYNCYLDLAESHLLAGWDYTNQIPWQCARVRLACAWPILIGLKTIARLRTGNPLDAQQRIKISRNEVRGILFKTLALYPLPAAWRRLHG
jgi:farnesyl-diphosphate farnesyltransferase